LKDPDSAASLINKSGNVINSYPASKQAVKDEQIFFQKNLSADPYMAQRAEYLIWKTGLNELWIPTVLNFRGDDNRLDMDSVLMHEQNQRTLQLVHGSKT